MTHRHCDPVTMDHIIELRKRVALLEKQLENALAWVTAKQREEAVARDVLKEMREALEPFAKKYLWPDDSGYADELRADEDWSEVGNDDTLDSCLIQRKWIRDAREALKEKE